MSRCPIPFETCCHAKLGNKTKPWLFARLSLTFLIRRFDLLTPEGENIAEAENQPAKGA